MNKQSKRAREQARNDRRDAVVATLLQSSTPITAAAIARHVGADIGVVIRLLIALKKEGVVAQVGELANRKWMANKNCLIVAMHHDSSGS